MVSKYSVQFLQSLEITLRSERLMLANLKDKISESGKPGYFIVQAQVNEFVVTNVVTIA